MRLLDAVDMLGCALRGIGAEVDLSTIELGAPPRVVVLPHHQVEVVLFMLPGARRSARLSCLVSTRTHAGGEWSPHKTWWIDCMVG